MPFSTAQRALDNAKQMAAEYLTKQLRNTGQEGAWGLDTRVSYINERTENDEFQIRRYTGVPRNAHWGYLRLCASPHDVTESHHLDDGTSDRKFPISVGRWRRVDMETSNNVPAPL